MKPLKVKDLELDDGSFKICVTLTARNECALMNDLLSLKGKSFDLLEWRADFFEADLDDIENLTLKPIKLIHKMFSEKPLLATFRDKIEGGQREIDPSKLLEIRKNHIDSDFVDIIDLELMNFILKDGQQSELNREYEELLHQAKEKGIKVILSNHDFNQTPEVQEMVDVLRLEEKFGADLAKIAYFAKDKKDAEKLLEASGAAARLIKIPHIAIAMGDEGAITRYSRSLSSSAVTFASISKSSAPGQLSLDEIRKLIR